MAVYDFDVALHFLRQAVDFAEIEGEFVPLRKWVNQVELSGHAMDAMDGRLSSSTGQAVLLDVLQAVASGALSPEEGLQQIRRWLYTGEELVTRVVIPEQVLSA